MRSNKIIVSVLLTVVMFSVGFVFWFWLFGLVFGGFTVLAVILSAVAFALAAIRKKQSVYGASFVSCAVAGAALFAGWCVRAQLRHEAMNAESQRLILRAYEFKKERGKYAHSMKTLAPRDATDRFVSWLAGDSVRYGGYATSFSVVRGDGIAGEIYSSDTGKWSVTKI